jgi:predicted DNA binding protein
MPSPVKVLNVLKSDGNRYTVLIKAVVQGKVLGRFMKLFDLDLIYDMPYYADSEHFKLSCIGDNDSIKKLVKMLGLLGKVTNISFTKATFSEFNVLNVLTEKQREIMIQAKKHGYYNYPRKVNSKELSERLGISKATTVEHLRKAEVRLITSLLEGYA